MVYARIAVDDTLRRFGRALKTADNRAVVVKAFRRRLREPLPAVRKAVRAKAKSTLPRRNGLGAWVAKSRINATISVSSRRVTMTVKAGRKSLRQKSDIEAIDRGRVRAPTFGRRTKGSWHTQTVPAGFFRAPVVYGMAGEWERIAVAAAQELVTEIVGAV